MEKCLKRKLIFLFSLRVKRLKLNEVLKKIPLSWSIGQQEIFNFFQFVFKTPQMFLYFPGRLSISNLTLAETEK